MSFKDKMKDLALSRLLQADESLDEARYLLKGHKSPRSVINRAYYSMFYGILALLIFEEFSSSKHTGVISYFNQRFIKTGLISKELGRAVNKAFDLRLRGDYREQTILKSEQVAPFIDHAQELITEIKAYLKGNGKI